MIDIIRGEGIVRWKESVFKTLMWYEIRTHVRTCSRCCAADCVDLLSYVCICMYVWMYMYTCRQCTWPVPPTFVTCQVLNIQVVSAGANLVLLWLEYNGPVHDYTVCWLKLLVSVILNVASTSAVLLSLSPLVCSHLVFKSFYLGRKQSIQFCGDPTPPTTLV